MQYIISKIPSAIAQEINGYLYDDPLTLEWHKFLHYEKLADVHYQIRYVAFMYQTEIVIHKPFKFFVKDFLTFGQYILQEIESGSLNWWDEYDSISFSTDEDDW